MGNESVKSRGVPEDKRVRGLMCARKDTGEQDTVVVAVLLLTKHRDIEKVGAATGKHFLDETRPRHAVANDNQTLT